MAFIANRICYCDFFTSTVSVGGLTSFFFKVNNISLLACCAMPLAELIHKRTLFLPLRTNFRFQWLAFWIDFSLSISIRTTSVRNLFSAFWIKYAQKKEKPFSISFRPFRQIEIITENYYYFLSSLSEVKKKIRESTQLFDIRVWFINDVYRGRIVTDTFLQLSCHKCITTKSGLQKW